MRSVNVNNAAASSGCSQSSVRGWMTEQTWMFILILIAFMFFAIVVAFVAKQIVDWPAACVVHVAAWMSICPAKLWWETMMIMMIMALSSSFALIDVVTAGGLVSITSELAYACHRWPAEQNASVVRTVRQLCLCWSMLFSAATFSPIWNTMATIEGTLHIPLLLYLWIKFVFHLLMQWIMKCTHSHS